jgi:tetratricopeptide (TPR) repeat protein
MTDVNKETNDIEFLIGWVDKGYALAKQGKHEEAIAYYDTVIRSDKRIGCDEDPSILFLKSTSLKKLGRDDEAKKYCDKAEKLLSNDQRLEVL